MPSLDYDRLADWYDGYCRWTGDLAFFRRVVEDIDGRVLELMAGTGRVTRAIAAENENVVAVDSSVGMIAVASRVLQAEGARARLVVGDVRSLPVAGPFERVVLPFQGFTELLTPADRNACLAEVARVLAPAGRFVCTSHNPGVRLQTIDGSWHEVGAFGRADGGRLVVRLVGWCDGDLVRGEQVIEHRDASDRVVETRRLDLVFSLVTLDEIERYAAAAGLVLVGVLGDYEGATYDPQASPAIIATFERRN